MTAFYLFIAVMKFPQLLFLFTVLSLIAVPQSLFSLSDFNWCLKAQYGVAKFTANQTKVPNNSEASTFDLPEATTSTLRLYLSAIFQKKHEFRLLLAPLEYEESINLDKEITFNGTTFSSDQDTIIGYRFNSYRLSYIYHFNVKKRSQYRLGLVGKVRDAHVFLQSDSSYSKYANTGFVPLLHLGMKRVWRERLCWDAELEGAWASQGYVLDFRTSLDHQVNNGWHLGLGAGFLDGGADNDNIKTTSTIFSVFFSIYNHF